MRVLVCGSRDWDDRAAIRRELTALPEDTVIICGGAAGADTIAAEIAKALGLKTEIYMAEWVRYGRNAGPMRNRRMLDDGKPDLVLAFYNPAKSRGTKDMISRATSAKIKVREFFPTVKWR